MLRLADRDRATAERSVQSFLEDLHNIPFPAEKQQMLEQFLWEVLAPIHSMWDSEYIPQIMPRLWKAALLKSIFGLGRVEKRLLDFTRGKGSALDHLPAEGVGLIDYLLNRVPDTFDRAIAKARSRLQHGKRIREAQIITLEQQYPHFFP